MPENTHPGFGELVDAVFREDLTPVEFWQRVGQVGLWLVRLRDENYAWAVLHLTRLSLGGNRSKALTFFRQMKEEQHTFVVLWRGCNVGHLSCTLLYALECIAKSEYRHPRFHPFCFYPREVSFIFASEFYDRLFVGPRENKPVTLRSRFATLFGNHH